MRKKDKWEGIFLIIILVMAVMGMLGEFAFVRWQASHQTVIANVMTEQASKGTDVRYDNLWLFPDMDVTPGHTYHLSMTFDVQKQQGKNMLTRFGKVNNDLASFGCTELEYSTTFVATKNHVQVYLQMAITDGDITGSDSRPINFKICKLKPIIQIQEEGVN